MDLNKNKEETELQYIWRLCSAKDVGTLDMTWDELANVLNKNLREDESEYYGSSAYRKKFQQAKAFREEVFSKENSNEYTNDLRAIKDEIYKERRKLYDQRREYNKLLVSDARADHLCDELVKAAYKLNDEKPLEFDEKWFKPNIHKEAVLCWADWHYGMVTDNIWNTYNTEICRQRVKTLVEITKEFLQLNNIDVLTILTLGDAAHGSIHTSCRIHSEEKTCDQLMHVSELMAEAINELSTVVNHIDVYSCYGNHMRTIQNKNDSVHSDNMERIIPWWLRQRLQNNTKVEIIETEYKEFTKVNILGSNIVALHGDLERDFKKIGTTVNTIFTKKFNETIDYTISADKHHIEEFEQLGIKSVLVPCLCGTDDHANEGRLYSDAGQTLIIFNDVYGRECTYHIPLS